MSLHGLSNGNGFKQIIRRSPSAGLYRSFVTRSDNFYSLSSLFLIRRAPRRAPAGGSFIAHRQKKNSPFTFHRAHTPPGLCRHFSHKNAILAHKTTPSRAVPCCPLSVLRRTFAICKTPTSPHKGRRGGSVFLLFVALPSLVFFHLNPSIRPAHWPLLLFQSKGPFDKRLEDVQFVLLPAIVRGRKPLVLQVRPLSSSAPTTSFSSSEQRSQEGNGFSFLIMLYS